MYKKIETRVLLKGWQESVHAAISLESRLPGYPSYQERVRGRAGLEIGGPSRVFITSLPLYSLVGDLDGVNFADRTMWEGQLQPGRTFNYFGARCGQQFIADATDLSLIRDASYDFILSSNCLEHVANPLKALSEWRRVLRDGGALVLVLPRKESNFDHRRPITSVEHLLADFRKDTREDDLTHLDEIMKLHDLARDPWAGSAEAFRARSQNNLEHRGLHHHVFDQPVMVQMLALAGFDCICSQSSTTDHFALAVKDPTRGNAAPGAAHAMSIG